MKNGHKIRKQDQARIHCAGVHALDSCGKPAEFCEYMHWSCKSVNEAKKPTKAKPKAKRELKKPAPGRRGVRKDGKPRRKPGTNKPANPEAAAFGKRMAKARHGKEWTQAVLAKKLGMGQPSIANIERGVIPAAQETQARIKKVLGF